VKLGSSQSVDDGFSSAFVCTERRVHFVVGTFEGEC